MFKGKKHAQSHNPLYTGVLLGILDFLLPGYHLHFEGQKVS